MQIDLSEQVALVTGSARRVGKAIALELAKQGASIVVHYQTTDAQRVRDTVQEIKSLGVDAYDIQADLRQPDEIDALFENIQQRFGKLHILVNNASVFQKRELPDVTLDEWHETLAVNLTAPLLLIQKAVPMMKNNVPIGGAIINICDRGALEPWRQYAHHGISKAALLALSQVSAVTYAPDIRVNAIIPGPVWRPAGRTMSDETWEAIGHATLLERTGDAGDVARAVTYLARESYITGTTLHVNGGDHLS